MRNHGNNGNTTLAFLRSVSESACFRSAVTERPTLLTKMKNKNKKILLCFACAHAVSPSEAPKFQFLVLTKRVAGSMNEIEGS